MLPAYGHPVTMEIRDSPLSLFLFRSKRSGAHALYAKRSLYVRIPAHSYLGCDVDPNIDFSLFQVDLKPLRETTIAVPPQPPKIPEKRKAEDADASKDLKKVSRLIFSSGLFCP